MPPGFISPLDRLSYCESRECVQKVVDDYLNYLLNRREEGFSAFRKESVQEDERTIANSYLFTEALITRVLETEIDLIAVIEDLQKRLGDNHPVLIFLKQLMDE